jgi:hypothetical protein
MRDNVDVWPQALWATARPRPRPRPRPPLEPDSRAAWPVGAMFQAGLLLAILGALIVVALVAPSAGAAGGCGGG